jgi:hypothetical protein
MGVSGGICRVGGLGADAVFGLVGCLSFGTAVPGSAASVAAAGKAVVAAMNSRRVMTEEAGGVMQVRFEQEQWTNGGELLPRHGHVPFMGRCCLGHIARVTESPRLLPSRSMTFFRKVSSNVLRGQTGSSWQ